MAAVISFIALENLRTGVDALGNAAFLWAARLPNFGYGTPFHVTLVFFSLGSILFFWLLLESRHIPRARAGFGILASVLVALLGFARLILPSLAGALVPAWAPIFIAEIATGTWPWLRGAAQAPSGGAGGSRRGPASPIE